MKAPTKSREQVYGFLSGIFRGELTGEQIEEMVDTGLLDLLADRDVADLHHRKVAGDVVGSGHVVAHRDLGRTRAGHVRLGVLR